MWIGVANEAVIAVESAVIQRLAPAGKPYFYATIYNCRLVVIVFICLFGHSFGVIPNLRPVRLPYCSEKARIPCFPWVMYVHSFRSACIFRHMSTKVTCIRLDIIYNE